MVVDVAVNNLKMNLAAKYFSRGSFSFGVIYFSISILNQALAKQADKEDAKAKLLQYDVTSALSYASSCEIEIASHIKAFNIAGNAAAVEINLLGRNEHGAELSQAAATGVLAMLCSWSTSSRKAAPINGALRPARAVEEMAIADRNKHFIMEHDGALEGLVHLLILGKDHPRVGQPGADDVQHVAGRVLLQLSLSSECAEALKSKQVVMAGLHELADSGLTAEARRCGKDALFQLQGRDTVVESEPPVEGSKGRPKHVMLSYCWDQQAVVKRVHAGLVERGYDTWIDIEQMMGSTVDSMAAAVENAEVVLLGVSRQYKESGNCRLEAQYAMQREVSCVPLMLADGYRADGWLGMLVGTRMWYGFYGSVLTDASAFEMKMSELCRELGPRGKVEKPN